MFYDSCMHTHTPIFHTFCPLPSIKDSCFRIWPCTSSLLSLPCPSPVSMSGWAIVMHMGPYVCVCVCGVGCRVNVSSPRPCVTTKLCGLCLFLVWRLTVSYISSLYGHCHWKFLYSVCVCVPAFVCLPKCTVSPWESPPFTSHHLFSLSTSFSVKQNTAVLKVTFKNKRFSNQHLL